MKEATTFVSVIALFFIGVLLWHLFYWAIGDMISLERERGVLAFALAVSSAISGVVLGDFGRRLW